MGLIDSKLNFSSIGLPIPRIPPQSIPRESLECPVLEVFTAELSFANLSFATGGVKGGGGGARAPPHPNPRFSQKILRWEPA